MNSQVEDVVLKLSQLEFDETVPRSIRKIIRGESAAFKENDKEINVKINRLLDVLEDISVDPSVSSDIRTQIWCLVSILESM